MTMESTKTERWLTPKEVAAMLGVATNTLANWRSAGPDAARKHAMAELPYARLGYRVRYRLADVEEFMRHQAHSRK